jgi:hypothetical protein
MVNAPAYVRRATICPPRRRDGASFSKINAYIAGVVEQNIQFALIGGAQG